MVYSPRAEYNFKWTTYAAVARSLWNSRFVVPDGRVVIGGEDQSSDETLLQHASRCTGVLPVRGNVQDNWWLRKGPPCFTPTLSATTLADFGLSARTTFPGLAQCVSSSRRSRMLGKISRRSRHNRCQGGGGGRNGCCEIRRHQPNDLEWRKAAAWLEKTRCNVGPESIDWIGSRVLSGRCSHCVLTDLPSSFPIAPQHRRRHGHSILLSCSVPMFGNVAFGDCAEREREPACCMYCNTRRESSVIGRSPGHEARQKLPALQHTAGVHFLVDNRNQWCPRHCRYLDAWIATRKFGSHARIERSTAFTWSACCSW